MKFKNLKKKARNNLKKNYWTSVAVIFFVFILLGNFNIYDYNPYDSNSSLVKAPFLNNVNSQNFTIINETIKGINKIKENINDYKPERGILANLFNNITASESFIFGILNSLNQLIFKGKIWVSITMLLGAIFSFLYYFFICNPLIVGENRFFLENINHKKTSFNRIFLPFKTGHYINVCKIMFQKTIYELLWYFTIIGGIIKHYEYALIPYILAENPGINSKEAFSLSKKMIQNHKLELFKLDLSFIPWFILDFLTFHFSAILYSAPFKKCAIVNYYMNLKTKETQILLCDKYLEEESDVYPAEKYIYEEKSKKIIKNNNYSKNYSITSLILMAFLAASMGWIWEVLFHFFQYGSIVNRGTLYGPWLPIYGWGAIALLVMLKKYRKDPIKTFIMSITICGIIEYFTSIYLEVINHASYWDYNGFFLNINGRVCLEGLLAFGICGCAFIYFGAPLLEHIIIKINKKLKIILCIFLCISYIGDIVLSNIYPHTGNGISKKLYVKENIT